MENCISLCISTVPDDAMIDNAASSASPLIGNVFSRDDDAVGDVSLHFDGEAGCYVSREHDSWSSAKLDDGTAFPSRIFFTQQTFDVNQRKFCGLADYGGSWNGTVSQTWEITFDTEYLCVLSGTVVYNKADGGINYTIGEDMYYTNTKIDGRANAQTVERLEKEGATDKSLLPFRKHARKYHRRVVIDEYFHWMTSDKYHNTYDVHTPLHLSSNTHD